MKLHGNAALSWSGRRVLARRVVVEGWTLSAAAAAAGVSVRCARKWVGRYRLLGDQGLFDRCSAPRRVTNRTSANRVEAIVPPATPRFEEVHGEVARRRLEDEGELGTRALCERLRRRVPIVVNDAAVRRLSAAGKEPK